ncbi:MAG: CoA-binding protein [Verrucomicrobiota bacterium]
MSERVVVLGASNKPDRYSYLAIQALKDAGHEVIPIHPALEKIQGISVVPSLDQVEGQVDTITVYVNPAILEPLVEEILTVAPKRVILNPGTESPSAAKNLRDAGIKCEEACTLVLLKTDQF